MFYMNTEIDHNSYSITCSGLHPDVIAQTLKLPPGLASDDFLEEHYGTVEWSIKTVFEARLGWFSGFPEDLLPLTPADEAERWLQMVTPRILLWNAQKSLKSGKYFIAF